MISSSPFKPSNILGTAVVPWTSSYQFDEEFFVHQVNRLTKSLTNHLYVFGTAGEGYAVSDSQYCQIASCFASCAGASTLRPMVGVISLSLETMKERIAFGQKLGIREFQVSLPAWGALNDVEVDAFFRETCGRFPECHFLHYNNSRCKRQLTGKDYSRLSEKYPNLVAVKSSEKDPARIAELLSAKRLFFYFTEHGYHVAREISSQCGLLASIATVNPFLTNAFAAAPKGVRDGYMTGLNSILNSLISLSSNRFHMDGAFDKLLWAVHEPRFPLRLLPPYESASADDAKKFASSIPDQWRMPSLASARPLPSPSRSNETIGLDQ